MSLEDLGWTAELSRTFSSVAASFPGRDLEPARVVAEHRTGYELLAASGPLEGSLSGKLRHEGDEHPAVGDWVACRTRPGEPGAMIVGLLPRRTKLSRKVAGTQTAEQVIVANVDSVWVVTALDLDLSPRRLERYLTAAWESGAQPAIVLTKADGCPDSSGPRATVEALAPGVRVHVVSAVSGAGLEGLVADLAPGRTVALVGSSGVGKSTLANRLLGAQAQRVLPIREDGRGRHTTTERRLFLLPQGGLLIDTPGMREFSPWEGSSALAESFADLALLAAGCRFRDCSHESEPGCAVVAAVESGELPGERLEGYHKLRRELSFLERKQRSRERAAVAKSRRRHETVDEIVRDSL